MKPVYLNQLPITKTASSSCKNCDRLTVIEGEEVCFREGKIIKLTPIEDTQLKFNLLCEGWKRLQK